MDAGDGTKTLMLFDVDGTLTRPRQVIDPELFTYLTTTVKQLCNIGIVSGSDLGKMQEQLGPTFDLNSFHYVFPENGLVAYKFGVQVGSQSIANFLGEEKVQEFVNYCLRYMSELELPIKRGTFIEFRTGLINVCPVGRSCSQAERDQFEQFDEEHGIRRKFVEAIRRDLPGLGLHYSIGGQISFDAFPIGWDKTYCLRYMAKDYPNRIHFFGDKTHLGGNDYELYRDRRVIGHHVTSPADTKTQVEVICADIMARMGL